LRPPSPASQAAPPPSGTDGGYRDSTRVRTAAQRDHGGGASGIEPVAWRLLRGTARATSAVRRCGQCSPQAFAGGHDAWGTVTARIVGSRNR
jgi:hypothetical protein